MSVTWYAPNLNGGEDKGLNDGGLQNFRQRSAVARETCQNVVDAHDPPGIATAEFTVLDIPTNELPGIDRFRDLFDACRQYELGEDPQPGSGNPALMFFDHGKELLSGDSVHVLRIRDSNTTGLSGDDQARVSRWYRLVRGQGRSLNEGPGGGAFGIGQRAPFAFSGLRLVFYSTRTGNQCRFMGKYLLCTCRDPESGQDTQNVGYFGTVKESAQGRSVGSITDEDLIPPFFRRAEQGTDIYIVGFRIEDWRSAVLRSVMAHFYATIDNDQLKVVVRDENEAVVHVGTAEIEDHLREEIEVTTGDEKEELRRAYFSLKALREGQTFTRPIPRLGDVSLFVIRDSSARNCVTFMRRPRMKVYEINSKLLREYQAVVLVDDEAGNSYLRELEDPTHQKWNADQPEGWSNEEREEARETLSELRAFYQEILRELRGDSDTQAEDLPELARWLPAEEDEGEWSGSGGSMTGEITDQETSAETGSGNPVTVTVVETRTSPQTVEDSETGTMGDANGETGAGGGEGEGAGGEGGQGPEMGPGSGERGGEEEGGRVIRPSDVRFRSWKTVGDSPHRYHLAVTSSRDLQGNLSLNAVGESSDEGSRINIRSGTYCETGEELEVESGALAQLRLVSGVTCHMEVELTIDIDVSLAVGGR